MENWQSDQEIYIKMVRMFIQTEIPAMESLALSLDQGRWDDALEMVRHIRTAAENLKMTETADAAASLESLCAASTSNGAKDAYRELELIFSRIQEGLVASGFVI